MWALSVRRTTKDRRLARSPSCGCCTALFAACMHGTAEDVQGALCGGCDPNSGTGLGITPLMVAFQRDDLRMVKALVRAGGDPTSVDGRGRMCIDYAHGARFVCRPF